MYQYTVDPIAAAEYKDAIEWYTERSVVAAGNFVSSFKEGIIAICNDPYRYRNPYRSFRELSLKKYPYYLVYLIDEDRKKIVITSVYHHKRNPKRKYIKD